MVLEYSASQQLLLLSPNQIHSRFFGETRHMIPWLSYILLYGTGKQQRGMYVNRRECKDKNVVFTTYCIFILLENF